MTVKYDASPMWERGIIDGLLVIIDEFFGAFLTFFENSGQMIADFWFGLGVEASLFFVVLFLIALMMLRSRRLARG